MSPRIEGVAWSEGASLEAMVGAFGEAALTVAVLAVLLQEFDRRSEVLAALRPLTGEPSADPVPRLRR